ncbi:[Acyl-carrier-protein] S-malonyltransferase [Flavobacteriaceae bacterium UJ101]|nr:[Acyl-carrier-protein] S-malonyltransferase [Flavobacteriaceae bacterium UJ101]
MKAYVFPGQGAQFSGMGKDLYDQYPQAKEMFEKANDILGFDIMKIMFEGSAEDLKKTEVTQPAIYIHSVIKAKVLGIQPELVAGHSLGEFSALAAIGVFSFEDGLKLVAKRATAMQAATEQTEGTMAAVLGLEDTIVEEVCEGIENVVPANYNCPGQLVISGAVRGIHDACEILKEKGAKRALVLPVGGAFHSPLMQPAREELAKAIENTVFHDAVCPVYQNVPTTAVTSSEEIKKNLIAQLTAPVKWTQSVQNMILDGANTFSEVGPGKVLQGLIKKINREVDVNSAE